MKLHNSELVIFFVTLTKISRNQNLKTAGSTWSNITPRLIILPISLNIIGDEHDKTKESSECLKHLTQQAVVLQKKMNEIYTGKSKTATLPPIQIQAPSMTSVLDMLNIINGILFVQINPRDIENLKNEFEKRQQTSGGSASPETEPTLVYWV